MNPNGRVSVCGWVGADSYNTNRKLFEADKFTTDAAAHNLEYVKFFLVGAYYSQMEEQQKKTAEWLLDGSVVARDDVRDGLENAAGYFIGMLKGENFGKATIRIKQE